MSYTKTPSRESLSRKVRDFNLEILNLYVIFSLIMLDLFDYVGYGRYMIVT